MSYMFANNRNLEEVDLSDLNTSNVKDFDRMFQNCTALKYLDLSNWKFKDCSKLPRLNWSHFEYLCNGCKNLEWVKFPLNQMAFNYVNGGGSDSLFSGCINLKHIYNMGMHFNGRFQSVFYDCKNLISLNSIHWNLTNISNKGNVFYNCNSLTTVSGVIENIDHDFDLHWSPLTNASAMVFINGLAEVSETKTIKFKSPTFDSLTPEQIAVATSKGWNVVRS